MLDFFVASVDQELGRAVDQVVFCVQKMREVIEGLKEVGGHCLTGFGLDNDCVATAQPNEVDLIPFCVAPVVKIGIDSPINLRFVAFRNDPGFEDRSSQRMGEKLLWIANSQQETYEARIEEV